MAKEDFGWQLNFFSSLIAGTVGCLFEAPINRVQLLMQTQNSSVQLTTATRYRGPYDCMTRIYSEQAPSAFWRGNLATVASKIVPTQAISFYLKEPIKTLLPAGDSYGIVRNIIGGALAGAVPLTLTYPFGLSYTLVAADVGFNESRLFKGHQDCLSKVLEAEGVRGMYRGIGISIIGMMVYRGAYFGLFDTGKGILFSDPKKSDVARMWAFAQFTTLASGLVTYPFDTVRKRYMTQAARASQDVFYHNYRECFSKILKQEGFAGFYGGLSVLLFRSIGGSFALIAYNNLSA